MRAVHDKSCLPAIYDACRETDVIKNRLPDKDTCIKSWEKLDVVSFIDKEPVGGVLFDSHKTHIAIKPSYQGRCGKLINETLQYGLDRYGFLIGEIHQTNQKAKVFVEKLGFKYFKKIGQYDLYIRYKNV